MIDDAGKTKTYFVSSMLMRKFKIQHNFVTIYSVLDPRFWSNLYVAKKANAQLSLPADISML
jgi:hypothetical protein